MLELFPLRSPLLGESLLVSFPPLIYMLKFSGWSRLIRGLEVSWDLLSVKAVKRPSDGDRCFFLRQRPYRPDDKITGGFGGRLRGTTTNRNVDSPIRFPPFRGNGCFHTIVKQTLGQTCSRLEPGAQFAFKDSMIHCVLQFALIIAVRCVLHRCTSRGVHR